MIASALAAAGVAGLGATRAVAQETVCSVWLIESSRFMNVPFGSFMPDRAFVPGSDKPTTSIPTVDLPVNIGVIKCGSELILYDTGWKQQDYLKMTGSDHWAPLGEAAHEPLSYTDKYPVTKNSWVALNGGRIAEIALAPGEKSRKP